MIVNPWDRPDDWMREFAAQLPNEKLFLWPDSPDPSEVELVVAWRMRRADLARFTNLQAILSLGAGAEQWQREGIPDVHIVRLADPAMAHEMATYALHWVIRLQRHFDVLERNQTEQQWTEVDYSQAGQFRVGILGYGTIGGRIGRAFTDLGYPVNAWSRSGTDDPSVRSFSGVDELGAFLGSSDAVINVLPSTDATAGLLTRDRLNQFEDGSIFINIGRGTVVEDEAALLDVLDHGPLRAAVLDVTDPEPPVENSRLYTHPAVHLTPHVAGSTQVTSAVKLIAENITRLRAGETPFPLVDRSRGY